MKFSRTPLFKVGTVVRLRSGGPPMTVAPDLHQGLALGSATGPPVKCFWFSGKKLLEGTFDPSVLVEVSPDGINK